MWFCRKEEKFRHQFISNIKRDRVNERDRERRVIWGEKNIQEGRKVASSIQVDLYSAHTLSLHNVINVTELDSYSTLNFFLAGGVSGFLLLYRDLLYKKKKKDKE